MSAPNLCLALVALAGSARLVLATGAGLWQSAPSYAQASRHILQTAQQSPYLLRLCNAYASSHPLSIEQLGSSSSLRQKPSELPLAYKQCRDISIPLQKGDSLNFLEKRNGISSLVGSFSVRELPGPGTTLLLIPHRRSPYSTAMTFASHIFSATGAPQIAVLDVYNGPEASSSVIEIEDTYEQHSNTSAAVPRREPLQYNSVVSLNPGDYQLSLQDSVKATAETDAKPKEPALLSVRGSSSYVVMRVGASSHGPGSVAGSNSGSAMLLQADFPEEIVVFPQVGSESGTLRRELGAIVTVVVLIAVVIGCGH